MSHFILELLPSTKVVVTFNLRLRNEFLYRSTKKIFFWKWFNFYEQTFLPVTTHTFSKLWFDNDNFNNRWKLRRKETSLLEQLFLKERNCPSPFNYYRKLPTDSQLANYWKHSTTSLLDNAPNYLPGCVIQKRYIVGFVSEFSRLWKWLGKSKFKHAIPNCPICKLIKK